MAISTTNLADMSVASVIVAQDGSGHYNGTTDETITEAIESLPDYGGWLVIEPGPVDYTINDTIWIPNNLRISQIHGSNLVLGTNINKPVFALSDPNPSTIIFENLRVFGNNLEQTGADHPGILLESNPPGNFCIDIWLRECGIYYFKGTNIEATDIDLLHILGGSTWGYPLDTNIGVDLTDIRGGYVRGMDFAGNITSSRVTDCRNLVYNSLFVHKGFLPGSLVLDVAGTTQSSIFSDITGFEIRDTITEAATCANNIFDNILMPDKIGADYSFLGTNTRIGLVV